MAIIQELESYVQSYPAGMDTVTDVSLSQNENGRQLRFKIIGVTIPAGSIAAISGTKPDGVVYSKAGTIEGPDTVIFDEDVQMTAVFGTWYAKIRIFNSGNTIASARVRFIIDKDPVDAGSVPSDSQLDGIIAEMEAYVEEARSVAYGSPLTASTAAAMTDQTKVYVYTGTETGYTAGHWYFWNGTEWHDGGVYNAVAVQTDKTLSVADKAADGKATGEALEHRIPVYSEDEYTSDSTPYLYRTTGGGVAVGTRELDEIVGGSVGWNQLIQATNWNAYSCTGSWSNNVYTFTASAQNGGPRTPVVAMQNGHKYIYSIDVKSPSTDKIQVDIGGAVAKTADASISVYQNLTALFSWTSASDNYSPKVIDKRTSGWSAVEVKNFILTDLTLLLGSTIADYIYSLETATAGAGVAKLKEWGFFAEDYYAYDAGSLQSVTGVSAHEIVGKNLLGDVEFGLYVENGVISHGSANDRFAKFIPVGNTREYLVRIDNIEGYKGSLFVTSFDKNMTYIRVEKSIYINNITPPYTSSFTVHNDAVYLSISGYNATYNGGVAMIGTTAKIYVGINYDGDYEPYTKHTYPLDSSVTLRGILKLDSNNKLYFDGDVYPPVGLVARRYGIVDLGTLNWSYNSTNAFFQSSVSDKKNGTENLFCGKYSIGNPYGSVDKIISGYASGANIYIKDLAYTTAASFKTAMSEVYLVYELATPTTEQADPYASVQICAEGGTEEYITTGIVPVGHNTKYPADLAGKLDSIPALPTTAGNYRLKVTVTGGVPSYEWVSA